MWKRLGILIAVLPANFVAAAEPKDPFAELAVYDGNWAVHATHPWSGAASGAIDHLVSRCHRFTVYMACEQTINSKPTSILVYTLAGGGHLNTRTIAPDGLAGGRGELSMSGVHWTYIDKPPASLKGNWSRVENEIVDRDNIVFQEYESADDGKTWRLVNAGEEKRQPMSRS